MMMSRMTGYILVVEYIYLGSLVASNNNNKIILYITIT